MKANWKSRWMSLVALVLAAGLTLQCQRPAPKSEEELEKQKARAQAGQEGPDGEAKMAPPAERVSALEAAFPPQKSALAALDVAAHLPADTLIVAAAANPQALLDTLGRRQLTKRFGEYYEKGVAEITQAVGHNLLDPANWPEVGVDPTSPMGFAYLNRKRPAGLFFGKLTSPDKFKTMLYAVGGRVNERMEPHLVGENMAICPRHDEEVCFVIRGNYGFFVFQDGGDEEGLAMAKAFAGRPLDGESLATNEQFKAALARLDFGRDVALYMNVTGLVGQLMGIENRWADESVERARKGLEEAQRNGNEGDKSYWAERLREAEEWKRREDERRGKQREAFSFFEDMASAISLGLTVEDRAIKMKGIVEYGKDSLLARAVRETKERPLLVTYLEQTPIYLFQGTVNVDLYVDLLDRTLKLEGTSIDELSARIKEAIGIDLRQDVLAVLSGEIGAGVTVELERLLAGDGNEGLAVGGAFTLGVTDEVRAVALLEKLAANPVVASLVKKSGERTWQVMVPQWHTVHVAVSGGRILATTSPEMVSNVLADRKVTSFVDGFENPELRTILYTTPTSGISMVDFGKLSWVLFRGFGAKMESSAMAARAETEEEAEVPESEAYKATQAELKELTEKVAKTRDDIETETNKRLESMLGGLGITAAVGQLEEGGYVMYGGHFIPEETVQATIGRVVEDSVELYKLDATRRREVWRMEDRRWELERKLQEQRELDIKKHFEEQRKKALEAPAPPAEAPAAAVVEPEPAKEETKE